MEKQMTNSQNTVSITSIYGPTSPGTVADWELFFARRALARIKANLGIDKMIELVQPQVNESNENFSKWISESNGKWVVSRTVIQVTGLKAEEFLAYHKTLGNNPPPALNAEPEHYGFRAVDGRIQVVESLGGHVTDIRFLFTDDIDIPAEDIYSDCPLRQFGYGSVGNEKIAVKSGHQFRNTDEGFEAILQIYFPAAIPEEVVEGHRQHLAVEHVNWFRQTAESLGRTFKPITTSR
jgi:uncharacterized protein